MTSQAASATAATRTSATPVVALGDRRDRIRRQVSPPVSSTAPSDRNDDVYKLVMRVAAAESSVEEIADLLRELS